MVVQDIIVWSKRMEELAGEVYRKAAEESRYSGPFREFLRRMAEDEAGHAARLAEVLDVADRCEQFQVDQVVMDQELRRRIEQSIEDLKRRLEQGVLTEREMIQAMVDMEFSELNPLFRYLVDRCQGCSRTLQKAASEIQQHEDRLQRFAADLPTHLQPNWHGRKLPKLGERAILVVDDEPALLLLYQQLLCRYGQVTSARNGREALDLIRSTAFDAILTDVDMPVMNGLELFHQAIAFDPDLVNRFVFYTGTVGEQEEELARRYPVTVLAKPVNIRLIMASVERLLEG